MAKERLLWLTDNIDQIASRIGHSIVEWNLFDKGVRPDKRQPIIIMMNGSGSSIESAMSLADIIIASKTPVYTINLGKVKGPAVSIYLAGERRAALENAMFILNEGKSNLSGNYLQLTQGLWHYQLLVETMKRFICRRLDLSLDLQNELLNGMAGKDLYIYNTPTTPGELSAINLGLVNARFNDLLSFD